MVVLIAALPPAESGTAAVVAAGTVLVSAPQYSAAEMPVTGPVLPTNGAVVRTSRSTRTWTRPPSRTRTLPSVSPQGAPPGATPWIVGSVGTLGASTE